MKRITSILLTVCMLLSLSVMFVNAETEDVNIEFVEHIFKVPNFGYGESFTYVLITDRSELDRLNSLAPEGEFYDFAQTLPENYFDEKALFVVSHVSESSAEYSIDSIVLNQYGVITMNYSYTEGSAEDIQQYFIVAELDKADIPEFVMIKGIRNNVSTVSVDFSAKVIMATINQDGTAVILEEDEWFYAATYAPIVIQSAGELNELISEVEANNTLDDYAAELAPDYFEENLLIIKFIYSSYMGVDYQLTAVSSDENGTVLSFAYSGGPEFATAEAGYAIVVECAKADILNVDNVYTAEAQNQLTQYSDMLLSNIPSAVVGDINGNGKVTASDYIMLKRYLLGGLGESALLDYDNEEKFISRADINGKGGITAVDYILLKRAILGQYEIVQ